MAMGLAFVLVVLFLYWAVVNIRLAYYDTLPSSVSLTAMDIFRLLDPNNDGQVGHYEEAVFEGIEEIVSDVPEGKNLYVGVMIPYGLSEDLLFSFNDMTELLDFCGMNFSGGLYVESDFHELEKPYRHRRYLELDDELMIRALWIYRWQRGIRIALVLNCLGVEMGGGVHHDYGTVDLIFDRLFRWRRIPIGVLERKLKESVSTGLGLRLERAKRIQQNNLASRGLLSLPEAIQHVADRNIDPSYLKRFRSLYGRVRSCTTDSELYLLTQEDIFEWYDSPTAVSICRRIISSTDESVTDEMVERSLLELGTLLTWQYPEEALEVYDNLVERFPNSDLLPSVRYFRGECYMNLAYFSSCISEQATARYVESAFQCWNETIRVAEEEGDFQLQFPRQGYPHASERDSALASAKNEMSVLRYWLDKTSPTLPLSEDVRRMLDEYEPPSSTPARFFL